ncbi:MAG TPA: hypothetical protein VF665_01320 [Longimicrobium sp.]|jgi:hypothetical protein|uniref:hypothetical protein n=1 Tax=Longimicrobium sp. TaxID=2029185 RepID=UPI002ED92525
MKTKLQGGTVASPLRVLELLADRFGAFEAIAMASIKLARHVPDEERSMDSLVAEAVLEFGDDLRDASAAVERWMEVRRAA